MVMIITVGNKRNVLFQYGKCWPCDHCDSRFSATVNWTVAVDENNQTTVQSNSVFENAKQIFNSMFYTQNLSYITYIQSNVEPYYPFSNDNCYNDTIGV